MNAIKWLKLSKVKDRHLVVLLTIIPTAAHTHKKHLAASLLVHLVNTPPVCDIINIDLSIKILPSSAL